MKEQYKTGDIPNDQEDRIRKETEEYINLHYTKEAVRTAVYWGCIAAARREYLLARKQLSETTVLMEKMELTAQNMQEQRDAFHAILEELIEPNNPILLKYPKQ